MTERILAEGQLPNGASARIIAGDTIDDTLASRIVDTLEAAFQD